ncbi:MAG: DUF1254 domain-containing protein [Pseudomonadota bacterium]|nr:DUF1254 domain-containing protein [Pseudomonadota bacterium]
MKRIQQLLIATTIATATLLTTAYAGLRDNTPDYEKIAEKGFAYGFPLVLMDVTKEGSTGAEPTCGFAAPLNSFLHVKDIPNHEFRAVVRPNVDTLYSSAFLDLSEGPLTLALPGVADRYILMAFLDAWSNNFAGLGTPTNTAEPGAYFITGPKWKGKVPRGYSHISSPTNTAWIIGRSEIKHANDIANVNQLQDLYQLAPYDRSRTLDTLPDCVDVEDKIAPPDEVLSMNSIAFFKRLSRLMIQNPPPSADKAILEELKLIGVGASIKNPLETLSQEIRQAVASGVEKAINKAKFSLSQLGRRADWSPNPSLVPLGDYGTDYGIRYLVALEGFGANRGEYAVYQNAGQDSNQEALSGEHSYSLTFSANELPPADAFWSVTVYDKEGYLVENTEQRYAVGSNSSMALNADGSLTVYFAKTQPEEAPNNNWVPTPDGEFGLTLRLYSPQESVLNGDWQAPGIEKLGSKKRRFR